MAKQTKLPLPDAVLLDLDGTLLDSMQMWEAVDTRFLARFGVEKPPDLSAQVAKLSIDEASRYFVSRFSLPCTPAEVTAGIEALAAEAYRSELPLKPGVSAFLDTLDALKLPYAIVTATYRSMVDAALERLHLRGRFRFVLTCADVGAPKTEPDIYLEAARRLGVSPARCMVAEDSLHCLQTAVSWGFFAVALQDFTADWDACRAVADAAFPDMFAFAEALCAAGGGQCPHPGGSAACRTWAY